MGLIRTAILPMTVLFLVAACAGPATQGSGAANQGERVSAPKRIVASVMGQPTSVVDRMNTAQVSIPGGSAIEMLANAALTQSSTDGSPQPLLGEAIPSTENGLWKLFPDGQMETTWRIREGARWHDGEPLTADDLVFATTIDRDEELPILSRSVAYQSVDSVTAVDARTVTVRWKRPFIEADQMFMQSTTPPLPRHLIGDTYAKDKAAFLALPYWNSEFIGTGAFRVKQFEPGSHVLLAANDQFVLGRPQLDEIEARFILDLNVIVTNLLAGAVDLSLGRGFSIENAIQLREQWRDGTVLITPRSWIVIHPQFMDPDPAVLQDVRFRRALMYLTDRQGLMDSLQGGATAVGHVFIPPSEPAYKDVEAAVTRYDYDPRRGTQMIEELGYAKGPDGTYRDAAGRRLALELRTYGIKVSDRATEVIADEWTKLGVATEPVQVPPQRITDREYMATYPGLLMYRQPDTAGARDISRLRSNLAPTADTKFVGSNYARYVNPEFDALIDRYVTTIPKADRIAVLRDIVRHISENLNLMGLFYDAEIVATNSRLQNIMARETELWDVNKWTTKA